jgi:ABC-type transport system substrate-binding protein
MSPRTTTPKLALDRRTLFGATLGLAALISLDACSDSGTSGGASGTVKWAWQLPTTWDPVTSSAGSDVQMLGLTYDALTAIDNKGNAIPHLVTSWKYNSDGTVLTMKLASGLQFSDGTALDATAVKKSLERGRDATGSLIAPQLADLKDVAAPDATTVVLTIAAPNYQYPNLLAGKTGMVVNPAVFETKADSLATMAAGSGPFVLDSYTQNDKGTFSANPKYFQADQIKLTGFELYPAADAATVVASLQSGQFNAALLPGSQVDAAKAAGLDVQVIDSLYVATLDVNTSLKPFDDEKVVEALHYAVDRDQLVKAGQFGIGAVDYQPFPPGYVGYNPALADIYAYNPTKAKQILSDAGYTDKIPVTLSAAIATGTAELIQTQLNAVGFDCTIESVPVAQFTELVYIQHSKQLALDGFAGREAPIQAFQVLFSDTGLMNPARQYDPAVKAAVAKVVETPLDDPKYPALLQAATKVAVEKMPNTFLYTVPRVIARSSKVSALPDTLALVSWEGVTAS